MQPSARISSSLSRCPCSSTKSDAPPALCFLRRNAGAGVGVRLFAANGTFCAVCGIFYCRSAVGAGGPFAQKSGLGLWHLPDPGGSAGPCADRLHAGKMGKAPDCLRWPQCPAGGGGGEHNLFLFPRQGAGGPAGGNGGPGGGLPPGGVRQPARLQPRRPGQGPLCAGNAR